MKNKKVVLRKITINDVRAVFFPKDFFEKYKYLGSVPYSKSDLFEALEPLVLFMDHKGKPWWCPRWFLRFLHLFGNDNSIVRLRNMKLSRLKDKITGGLLIWDYKTKWTDYDLRISIGGTEQMHDLAQAIEGHYYNKGYRKDLADQIKKLDPDTRYDDGYDTFTLKKELDRIQKKKTNY